MESAGKEVRSIALIDDDRDDFDLVVEAIREINPEITVTYIGSCDEVQKYKRQHFDLVLLDINMPRHDGFHWLKGIRDFGLTNLPIVMYTNSLSPAHIARAYAEGANLYFAKPVTFANLISGFRKLVQLDWSDPVSITSQYKADGQHLTFSF